jgi:Co/Zn/Cd efflux system component
VVTAQAPGSQDELLREIDHRMRERHHIQHSTVQVESAGFSVR